METLTSLLVLAALAEALVEYLIRPLVNTLANAVPAFQSEAAAAEPRPVADDPPPSPPTARDLILRYLAAAVGIALAFAYQVDMLTLFGLQPPWPWLGYLVTGVILGRGSNFVHDFAGRWLTPAR